MPANTISPPRSPSPRGSTGLQSVLPGETHDALETARPNVGPVYDVPVETLEGLRMTQTLRSMLGATRTPDPLRHVYRDLRERIESTALATEDQAVTTARERIEPFLEELERRTSALEEENASMRSVLDAHARAFERLGVNFVRASRDTHTSPGVDLAPIGGRETRGSTGRPMSSSSTHTTGGPFPPRDLEVRANVSQSIGAAPMRPHPQQASRPDANVPRFNSPHEPLLPAPSQVPAPYSVNPTVPRGYGAPTMAPYQPPMEPYPSATAPPIGDGTGLGPECPGLTPHRTMLDAFAKVVSYRSYRLANVRPYLHQKESENVSRLKKKVEGLFPALKPFDGKKPISILGFLSDLCTAFDTLGVCEGVAVRVLHFFLDGEARTFYRSQTAPGVSSFDAGRFYTWPHVVDGMLKRYLHDDVLQAAYETVTHIAQRSDEDEEKYADRLHEASRNCHFVFSSRELVHHYVRGLLPTTRALVAGQVSDLTEGGRDVDLSRVRTLATRAGTTYRASIPVPTTTPRSRARTTPTLLIPEPPMARDPEPTPFEPFRRDPRVSHISDEMACQAALSEVREADPALAYSVASTLEAILFANASPLASSEQTPSTPGDDRTFPEIPELTSDQRSFAESVIPKDYWSLECWTCRERGHGAFTCPYLTAAQRLYFAYRYYAHQVEANPQMAHYYRQRMAKRASGSNAETRAAKTHPNANAAPRSPRGAPERILSNPNRRGSATRGGRNRDSRRGVSFGGRQGVYVTTHISDEPPEAQSEDPTAKPTWAAKESDDSDTSEN